MNAKFAAISACFAMLLLSNCATKRNTLATRWWQSFHTKYNVYYNASVAYIDASLEKENEHHDHFTEQLPLYTIGNKESRAIGQANYDLAIAKCEKAIRLHSIKRHPIWDKNRRKTPEDVEWLNRREYNPTMWKVWLLMGRAQFFKGDFENAISTFSYMSRLYATQPAIYQRAQAWLAKSYIEAGWHYDAEEVLRNMARDSMHWQAQKEWDYTYADYYLHTGDTQQAIVYLQRVIQHEMRRKQKAREWFLLGQLFTQQKQPAQAYEAFKKVIALNPSYELSFHARIAMTEVMAPGNQQKMIAKLHRMARNENNQAYLDQVFYALGNIYLAQRDTLRAIEAYEQGNERATQQGIEKGVLLLKLGNLYWDKERFGDAKRCYNQAIGLLDRDRKDYDRLALRQQQLERLVPFTDEVALQDSLQRLSKMSDAQRDAIIKRMIAALKQKERRATQPQNDNTATGFAQPIPTPDAGSNTWYFYNPVLVARGIEQFQRTWGHRKNEDNWQRENKTVVNMDDIAAVPNDTLNDKTEKDFAQQHQASDSLDNDPHQPAYYLKQIPHTPAQLQASNEKLSQALFHSGLLFNDLLDRPDLSQRYLLRLLHEFPSFTQRDEVYHRLYLIYMRQQQPSLAQHYLQRLEQEYPQSEVARQLRSPHYAEDARRGEQIEDSLYTAAYEAFKHDDKERVDQLFETAQKRFPKGNNHDKFLIISALNQLHQGRLSTALQRLSTLLSAHPNSPLATMAGMIINGIQAGKTPNNGRFDLENVWQRRSEVLNDSDALHQVKFSNERQTPFLYVMVYAPDAVNENQLLFELAKYNFTNYLVRNFDIQIERRKGMHQMTVGGFQNYDEALQYARAVHQQTAIQSLSKQAHSVIISQENLALIGHPFSYRDYEKFYQQHFAPLKISTLQLLTEPVKTVTKQPEKPTTAEDIDRELERIIKEDGSEYPIDPTDWNIKRTKTAQKVDAKTSKKAKPEKPKPPVRTVKPLDLDDEYYDLEGF